MATANIGNEGYNLIQAYHDEACMYLSQGFSYDEKKCSAFAYDTLYKKGCSVLACDMYKKGLEKINAALNIRCDQPYQRGPKWDKARALQLKMELKKQDIERILDKTSDNRKEEITPTSHEFKDSPPTYSEVCLVNKSGLFQPLYPTFTPQNENPQCESFSNEGTASKVDEIFYIPNGIQLFFISVQGTVTAPSSLNSLHIYQLNKISYGDKKASTLTWLQVGSWKYSLVRGQSTVLESSYGAFIFPDGSTEEGTSSVGVILPVEIDLQTRKRFENLLNSLIAVEEYGDNNSDTAERYCGTGSAVQTMAATTDSLLLSGAKLISYGLVSGAEVAGEYIYQGATALTHHLHPEENSAAIDQRVKNGFEVAKAVTTTALQISSFVIGALCNLTMAVGRTLAPYVREQSIKLVGNTFEMSNQQAKDTVDGFVKVAGVGIMGLSTIYLGLENSAKILAASLSTGAVEVIGHKYGIETADIVDNALCSIGNLALLSLNVKSCSARAITRETARDAGKGVLVDYTNRRDQTGNFPHGRNN